jgi:hypothetical protein
MYMHITDVPLRPSPEFVVVNSSTVGVEWEPPFTLQGFRITNYTVMVTNQTSGMELAVMEVLSPDTLSYYITRIDALCINMSFSVWATNSVGASQPGIVHGAFPVSKWPTVGGEHKHVRWYQEVWVLYLVSCAILGLYSLKRLGVEHRLLDPLLGVDLRPHSGTAPRVGVGGGREGGREGKRDGGRERGREGGREGGRRGGREGGREEN